MKIRNKGKRRDGHPGDYIVFDLETTGVNPDKDDIIEISALKVRDHEVKEEYSALVNPGRHIPAQATAVNGITDEMVADAPDIKTVMAQFMEFIALTPISFMMQPGRPLERSSIMTTSTPCTWRGAACRSCPITGLRMLPLTFRLKRRALTGLWQTVL